MYQQDFEKLSMAGAAKLAFMQQKPGRFFLASTIAGAFIALGAFVSMTLGGVCTEGGSPYTKIITAAAFSSALSLVIMAGAELFTGNNLTVGAAVLRKKGSWKQAAKLWGMCWAGNLAGSWLMVLLYHASGAGESASTRAFFAAAAAAKVGLPATQMFLRGILCNICVCLAVWCALRMKTESGKLIMVLWCILIFMVCGFEHSIANMSIIGVALVQGASDWGGYLLNLAVVTAGNMVGGVVFTALPYHLLSRE